MTSSWILSNKAEVLDNWNHKNKAQSRGFETLQDQDDWSDFEAKSVSSPVNMMLNGRCAGTVMSWHCCAGTVMSCRLLVSINAEERYQIRKLSKCLFQLSRVGNYATVWMDSWRITQQILYNFRNKFLTSSPRNSIIALFDAWRSLQM